MYESSCWTSKQEYATSHSWRVVAEQLLIAESIRLVASVTVCQSFAKHTTRPSSASESPRVGAHGYFTAQRTAAQTTSLPQTDPRDALIVVVIVVVVIITIIIIYF